MGFLILLLSSCLIFGATANFTIDSKILIVHKYVIPKHYDIQLTPLIYLNEFKFIIGHINTEIEILQPTHSIRLHTFSSYVKAEQFVLLKKETDELKHVQTEIFYHPISYKYVNSMQILILYFNTTLVKGTYILKMKFESIIDNNELKGSFLHKTWHTNKNGLNMWSIATCFEPMNARRVIPCWDELTLRATFQISIKHDKNYTVLSNTPIQTQKFLDKNDMMLTIFEVTPAMPTYLVAFVVSNNYLIPVNSTFHIKSAYLEWQRKYWKLIMGYHIKPHFFDTNPITNNWFEQDSLSVNKELEFAQVIAECVSQLFGIEWSVTQINITKIMKMDYIVIPDLRVNSIQNWGIILYRRENVIYKIDKDSVAKKINVANLVASGVVHQWFGNLVSPSSWSNIWVNDGIAILFGIDAVDKILPDLRIMDLFVVQYVHESLHLDNYFMKPLISEINDPSKINSWSFSRYIKAPVIFRMMHMLYDDAFRRGLQRYVNKHALKSATLDDLWTAIQVEIPDSPYVSKSPIDIQQVNISHVMDAWTKQMHYPILNVKRDVQNTSFVIVSVENNISDKDNWFILVTITTETELNFFNIYNNYTSHWLILTPSLYQYFEIYFPHKTEEWIIVNIQQMGYYRVNYDIQNWQKIRMYLNSDKYSNIHVLNRAQIIDDAFHLTIAGELESSIFWDLTSYLKREKDYIAWYPMIKIFEYMSRFFSFQLRNVIKIKVYFSNILSELLPKIGYYDSAANINDTTKYLIQEATRWACTLELPECLITANQELKKHFVHDFKASEYHIRLYPWWKEWTYCKGLMIANITTWSATLDLWKKTADSKILEYLACIKNFDIIVQYLSQTVQKNYNENPTFQTIEHINIFFSIIAKHTKNNKVFEHILINFEKLKPRKISTTAALTYIINHIYSKKQLEKIKQFVNENVKSQNLKIQDKLELRWSQIKRLVKYFLIF